MNNKIITLLIAIVIAIGSYVFFANQPKDDAENDEIIQKRMDLDRADVQMAQSISQGTVVQNLKIPWEAVFLPDGDILVTERPGNLKRIGQKNFSTSVFGVKHLGEGGLLGLTLHPNFSSNNFVYLYYTYSENSGGTKNKVVRYKLEDDRLIEDKVIIDSIPASSNHNGGRIKFSPDGFLFITTGDSENSSLAQDRNSLAGKILRLRDDGEIPSDNPFGNAVWSWGHRNVQGIAWDNEGRLWATEHGRSGGASGFDELNLIKKGANYGWPEIQGDERRSGMETPVVNSGATTTWAPSGMTFLNGSILFSGLRGQAVYEYRFGETSVRQHFKNEFGRIRNIFSDRDGNLYLLTNNTDGRGTARAGDDKIIKVNLVLTSD